MHKIYSTSRLILLFSSSCLLSAWIIVNLESAALSEDLKVDSSLGTDSSIVTSGSGNLPAASTVIAGGAKRGANLFHSFDTFNIENGQGVYFNNPVGVDRIITRITGSNPSIINGTLGVLGGADLFLLNPNGVQFGSNASLNLSGSFLATTASGYLFPDTDFSTTPTSLSNPLSIYLPIGLQFRSTPGSIINQSTFQNSIGRPIGLAVIQGKTLSLVGGDVTLDKGILTAPGGRLEIGSVTGSSQVKLDAITGSLGYAGVANQFGDINLTNGATLVSRDSVGGNINLQGRNISISNTSLIGTIVTSGTIATSSQPPGKITITASDSFTLKDSSQLITSPQSNANSGDIVIDADKVFLLNKSFIQASPSFRRSAAGIITIFNGRAGNVTISTTQINISGGSYITTSTIGTGGGGNIAIIASQDLSITGNSSGLFADSTVGAAGQAGNIRISTPFLRVSDGATLSVSGAGKGAAGNLTVDAQSILLENGGKLSARTLGGAGNINIISDNIILLGGSSISTSAKGIASGGNININTSILTALENSDIAADSEESFGGRVSISASRIFGTQYRLSLTPQSDITASSALGPDFSGTVELNVTAVDPNQGLVELPATVVDPTTLVAQNPCKQASSSEFTRSGRGGLPPSLSQDLNGESTQVGLVEPVNISAEMPETKSYPKQASSLAQSSSQIAPAQGWVYNSKGEVVLVAYNSAVTGSQRLQTAPVGCPVF